MTRHYVLTRYCLAADGTGFQHRDICQNGRLLAIRGRDELDKLA